jgi:hypothetical protein
VHGLAVMQAAFDPPARRVWPGVRRACLRSRSPGERHREHITLTPDALAGRCPGQIVVAVPRGCVAGSKTARRPAVRRADQRMTMRSEMTLKIFNGGGYGPGRVTTGLVCGMPEA